MTNASDELVSRQSGRTKPYKSRPGWNDHGKGLQIAAKECFALWDDAGKLKQWSVLYLI